MAGKKSFTAQQNPALTFISVQESEPIRDTMITEGIDSFQKQEETTASASSAHIKQAGNPEGFKVNPIYVETKSRRMQLLVQPSLYEAIKAKATAEGVSVNELIHTILEQTVKGNG